MVTEEGRVGLGSQGIHRRKWTDVGYLNLLYGGRLATVVAKIA
jgi:hypothetical protein